MSLIKSYHYQNFSVFDIKDYLEKKGFQVEFYYREGRGDELHVIGTDVYIDLPYKDINQRIFAHIRLKNYPRTENYEKSKKLYAQLKKKFGRSDGVGLKIIKDYQQIKEYRKEELKKHKKKTWVQ